MAGNVTIFRTSNPVDFTQVDGVYVDESRPPGPIRGIGNDIVCCIGHFERGPVDVITSIGSSKELEQVFGDLGPDASDAFYPGALSLRNKQFARLRVIRISPSGQVVATDNIADGAAADVIQVDADSPGAWGNSLSWAIEAATDGVAGHFNLVVTRDSVVVEKFRNLDLTAVLVGNKFAIASNYITLTKLAAGDGRPANATATALATGADGTPADADYTGAIDLLESSEATNIRWVFVAETSNDVINAALLTLTANTSTKIAVICGASGDAKAAALTDVVDYRSDRVVYVYPWVQTFVAEANSGAGANQLVAPNSFAAAAMAALAPGRDPAGVNAEPFLTGVRALNDNGLTRNDYISFNEQGIMALQFTAERQRYGFRSGITTSLDTALTTIARRTMADFLQESIAASLVFYQNLPLTQENKLMVKGAIEDFLEQQQVLGLLPTKEDLLFGENQLIPFVVDIDSGNTPAGEALGLFIIDMKIRIFSSMRFIVLRTEIGQGVEITVEDAGNAAA